MKEKLEAEGEAMKQAAEEAARAKKERKR